MADQNLDATRASGNPVCVDHPGIILSALITCPLCAQEARQRAYRRQRLDMAIRLAEAASDAPTPATGGLRRHPARVAVGDPV